MKASLLYINITATTTHAIDLPEDSPGVLTSCIITDPDGTDIEIQFPFIDCIESDKWKLIDCNSVCNEFDRKLGIVICSDWISKRENVKQ